MHGDLIVQRQLQIAPLDLSALLRGGSPTVSFEQLLPDLFNPNSTIRWISFLSPHFWLCFSPFILVSCLSPTTVSPSLLYGYPFISILLIQPLTVTLTTWVRETFCYKSSWQNSSGRQLSATSSNFHVSESYALFNPLNYFM